MSTKFRINNDKRQRLDSFVALKFTDISRSYLKKQIIQGKVKVNGVVEEPGYKLKKSDKVETDFNLSDIGKAPEIELPIIYEDSDCIVVNKPSGVLSHSASNWDNEPSVASFIRQHTKMTGVRSGIVHRLDRATSGVMICAKSESAMTYLQKQFSSRKALKTYVAVVLGNLKEAKAIIDMPLARNMARPGTFTTSSDGKSAITEYEVKKSGPKYDLVYIYPKTGRTHQIRVHFAKLGHPVLGDTLYGHVEADRLFLHAYKLEITIPSGELKTFIASIPKEFDKVINND